MSLRVTQRTTGSGIASIKTGTLAPTRWKNEESAENIQNYKGRCTKLLFASVLSKSLFLRVIRLKLRILAKCFPSLYCVINKHFPPILHIGRCS